MEIKDILNQFNKMNSEELLTNQNIDSFRVQKSFFSKRDERYLLKRLSEFRNQDVHFTFCVILVYSIWKPDEAIIQARKKGVFRYKAWGFKVNYAELLLNQIKKSYTVIHYRSNTKQFIDNKLKMTWMFEFYKQSEKNLIKYIENRHLKRNRYRYENVVAEEALFKELLVYADVSFYKNVYTDISRNKNLIEGYGHEDVINGISYIIYLYNEKIGIKKGINYTVSAEHILSQEIKNLILVACKVNQLQEWELCIDYFDYNLKFDDRSVVIFDKTELFEKSIRLGYIKREFQEQIFHQQANYQVNVNDSSLYNLGDFVNQNLGERLIRNIGEGKLSRYRFEFPEYIFELLEFNEKYFSEEAIHIMYNANEMIMSNEEFLQKRITENCTLKDIVLFKRLFIFLNYVTKEKILSQKDDFKKIRSLVPHLQLDVLSNLLTKLVGDKVKAQELMEFFTFKKGIKLDLQYTPFIEASAGVFFSLTLITQSNLLRNSIAHSYLTKNQIVNQDELESLVQECVRVFSKRNEHYKVFYNKKIKFNNIQGEIDVLVVSDNDIIIIECKSPLNPSNNFEMRSSFEHTFKAVNQLNHCKAAFMDNSFRKKFLKNINISDGSREISTCIVFGNRLFNGQSVEGHPIRYIKELNTILNDGHVYSGNKKWRIWKGENYHQEELISFLSPNHPLIVANLNSMKKIEHFLFVKGKKVRFETFEFNLLDAMNQYDLLFTSSIKQVNEP